MVDMRQYQLKPSNTILRLNLGLYCLTIAIVTLYFAFGWMSLLAVTLGILLMYSDVKKHRRTKNNYRGVMIFSVADETVEYQEDGVHYQLRKNEIVTNRWSVMLTFDSHRAAKKMVLLADCFQSLNDYLDMRYRIIQLKRSVNAT